MYQKTITFTDFKGLNRTEIFCFNMTEVELIKWVSQPGGYSTAEAMDSMLKKENSSGLMDSVEELLKLSYGEISLDGKRFVKTKEIQDEFFESNAYPKLFLELATNSDEAARFFNEVFPANIQETIEKIRKNKEANTPAQLNPAPPTTPTTGTELRPVESSAV